jgi:hypothetical protein
MQGMSPKQKAAFKKGDKKMDKKNPSKPLTWRWTRP